MTPGRRRLVVVSYFWPPLPSIGAQRWVSMTRHLEAMGHEVTVVTSAAHGRLPDDDARVHRTGDLSSSDALRRLLRRPPLPEPGKAATVTPAPTLLTDVVVPDSHLVSWAPTALAAVRRLQRAGRVDCVITTGPPDSTHVVGLALGRRRPAWIADFRDGWRFEPMRPPWPTRPQDRLDGWLERRVARRADVVAAATLPIAEDLVERLGADAHWVTNGFEPEIAAPVGRPIAGHARPARLVHTGTLSGLAWGRDPRAMLGALRAFNERAQGGRRIELVLAGRLNSDDERMLGESGLGQDVRHLGLLDHAAALELQRGADALLLVTGRNRSEATGKLFEYLASGRPVIAVAHGNEAARIVSTTGTGRAVDRRDPAALQEALQALADGTLEREYSPGGLEHFRYPGPARELASLVERAIERRLRSARRQELSGR